jgi:hypothetical protein
MADFLRIFQYRLSDLHQVFLLVLAIATLAIGLFAWLGGLGFRKIMFGLVGAYCGAAFAVPISGSNVLLAAALVGIGVLVALKLQDAFLPLMTSIFATIFGFSSLIRPYFNPSGELVAVVRQLTIGVPYYNWPILLFLIAAPFAASSSFWQSTGAVLRSAAGAAIMLAGVIMLMVHSGIATAGFISTKREFFLEIFIAVTILGAIMQLLVLPKLGCQLASAKDAVRAKVKKAKKDKHDNSKVQSTAKTSAWRTA